MRAYHRTAVIAFFVTYLLVGFAIVDDFGISWDEGVQRRHGHVTIEYVADLLGLDHPPMDTGGKGFAPYGMIFQIAATLVELQLGATGDPYRYYRIRHILNFLLFGVALIFFYRTLRMRWPERLWYPLLGTALLVLSPRIFGHAFFNPKDHTLLVFYLIATYTLLNFLRKRTSGALAWHVLASALVLNTRLPSLIILAATVLILLWEQVTERPGNYRRLGQVALYLPLSLLLMVPFFPYLWTDPGPRFSGALSSMADYDWGGTALLFGKRLQARDLPAYYVPGWIVVTTPVAYLIFMLTGLGRTVAATLRRGWRGQLWSDRLSQMDFIQLGLSCGPILVVIALGSTLYQGWRHLHFIYPGLVFLGVVGFDVLHRHLPRVAPTFLAIGLSVIALDMIRIHPQQQVYFNEMVGGKPLIKRFDMDYWGVGFRQAFIQLAKKVPEGEVWGIRCETWPCADNLRSLPPAYQGKLKLNQDWLSAHYVATNFLYVNDATLYWDRQDYFARPVLELAPRGDIIIGIYKLNPSGPRE